MPGAGDTKINKTELMSQGFHRLWQSVCLGDSGIIGEPWPQVTSWERTGCCQGPKPLIPMGLIVIYLWQPVTLVFFIFSKYLRHTLIVAGPRNNWMPFPAEWFLDILLRATGY